LILRRVLLALVAAATFLFAAWGCTNARPEGESDTVTPPLHECNSCHGNDVNAAPPKDLRGGDDPTSRGVGAHQAHLADGSLARAVECGVCHIVPNAFDAPGHADATWPAEVTFSGLALADGAEPETVIRGGEDEEDDAYDALLSCRSTYCHGGTLAGGTHTEPDWNQEDPDAKRCDACHGNPPPAPHPALSQCTSCHPHVGPDGSIADPSLHINGVVDSAMPGNCGACHGTNLNPAPPPDLTGGSDPASPGVGAHLAHLTAAHQLSGEVPCEACHVVPTTVDAAGHLDDPTPGADVTFHGLALADGASPTWDVEGLTCDGVYCHGATLSGGQATTPDWTDANGQTLTCDACHGNPPLAPHVQSKRCGMCHDQTANPDGSLKDRTRHINGTLEVAKDQTCHSCHGSTTNDAPPKDLAGSSDQSLLSVGAHQSHLQALAGISSPVTCQQCHTVPASVSQSGHLDASPADLVFGPLATTGGLEPEWDRETGTCSATYCHGASLSGGANPAPLWTTLDGTQAACGTCHGLPPQAPHLQGGQCFQCHADTVDAAMGIQDPAQHVDGQVDASLPATCNGCHGNGINAAPPVDLAGESDPARVSVGAHQSHLLAPDGLAAPVACDQCHLVPLAADAFGHVDPSPAEVSFGALATTGGVEPLWDGVAATCSSTYCHGATLTGGSNKSPLWTAPEGNQAACGTCHGNPPPAPHVQSGRCSLCHGDTADDQGGIKDALKHVDGTLQVAHDQACNACHGGADGFAPPKDTHGSSDTSHKTVGAHQAHLGASSGISSPVKCEECHQVPGQVGDAGHVDDSPAEVSFGDLASHDQAEPAWNGDEATCSNTYCHGATLTGGSNNSPLWTKVDGTQDACGTCHGNPPPAPHVQSESCGLCHTATMAANGGFKDVSKHVDGVVEVSDVSSCHSCHGSETNDAPPVDTHGASVTGSTTVGAHQSHLRAAAGISAPVACSQCHQVPQALDSEGHLDAGPAEVSFGDLATAGGASPAWNAADATCSSTYCHGATLGGGSNKKPAWTTLDGTQAACGTCHGFPPPAPHVQSTACGACHSDTIDQAGGFKDPGLHVDGVVQLSQGQTCHSCHGSELNDAPPKDTQGSSDTSDQGVGAHQSHLQALAGISEPVSCDQCHAVPNAIDRNGHIDGLPAEVSFGSDASAGGANPTWDGTSATCSSTYCHGATLEGGANTAPTWTTVDGSQATCGSCHGNPPPAPHAQSDRCYLCHAATVNPDGSIKDPSKHLDGVVDAPQSQTCHSCHGSEASDAPPVDLGGNSSPAFPGVGAHQGHLTAAAALSAPIACDQCHLVPAGVDQAGHLDAAPADVTFGALATHGGAAAEWSAVSGTCSNTYCHGATLAGGLVKTPAWTSQDGSQTRCDSCHGNPPPAPHAQSELCGMCHAETTTLRGGLKDVGKHLDGTLQVSQDLECNACHGNADNPAPPASVLGATATAEVSVGAHQSHLRASSSLAAPVACDECHAVPAAVESPGHVDAAPAEVTFGALAGTGDATPSWDEASATCSSTYCHGATLHGGSNSEPLWTKVDGTQDACGTCHGNPPPAPHAQSPQCGMCHTDTANLDGTLKNRALHINGQVELSGGQTCHTCHGSVVNSAPPVDTTGSADVTRRSVGAHQSHLRATAGLSAPVACVECHDVPTQVSDASHMDAPPAELAFGALATTGGLAPAWSTASATCSGTWCHGASLSGGKDKAPLWTRVDGTQAACDSCHGNPPPAPHIQSGQCYLCHAATINVDGSFRDATRHVNGTVEASLDQSCNSCHGSSANAAPPVDTLGSSDPTRVTVGAHQSHLQARGGIASPVACEECHLVPIEVGSLGHMDVPPAEIAFGTLAASGGANPTWDAAQGSCSSTYCHGATLGGGTATSPDWTTLDGSQEDCDACHGNPPPAPHVQSARCGMCHQDTANLDGSLRTPAKHVNGVLEVSDLQACNACHGNALNAAPPVDTAGSSDPSRATVGAHQAHLQAQSGLSAPVACDACHLVPAETYAFGHIDDAPAEVRFGALAGTGGLSPLWDGTSDTCSNTWCHGAKLTGGSVNAPLWTRLDGSQDACGTCHGDPPPAPHAQSTQCGMCHTQTANLDGSLKDAARHVNGQVEVQSATSCHSCHGSAASDAPPVDTLGGSALGRVTVGAHQAHLQAPSGMSSPVACTECHKVPASAGAAGHIDLGPAEVSFGALATGGGVTPAWDRGAATCASTYCHGATLSGGTLTQPTWTRVDGTQDACGTCHGNPPPAPHVASPQCSSCHVETMNADGTFKNPAKHIDGVVELPQGQTCHTCHGSATNNAPPVDTQGLSSTSRTSVGAHQAHVRATSGLGKTVGCDQCHVVPGYVEQPGHADTLPAEVTFGALASQGTTPAWDGDTCSSTYCHGTTLPGGTNKAPLWTRVDGSQDACGTCHGNPPPAPHAQTSQCGMCHTQTANLDGTIKDSEKHVDGVLQVAQGQACTACHGNAVNAAPPVDTLGSSNTALKSVGAHQSHLRGASGLFAPVACDQCHLLPSQADPYAHVGATPAEVTFGSLARTDGAAPAWNAAGGTCSGTYCHGATLGGGTNKAPLWTRLDGTQDACGTCHGNPPPAPHVQSSRCGLCHTQTALPDGGIANPALHADGTVQVETQQACNACHGSAANAAPPLDTNGASGTTRKTVGAHQAHVVAPSGLSKPLDCAECHLVPTDELSAGHVDASPAELIFGSLAKTGGLTPAWDSAGATCSATWCHGAGLKGGSATAPLWTKVDGTQDTCGSCHGFPPPAPHVAAKPQHCWLCHPATVDDTSAIKAPAKHVNGTIDVAQPVSCNACHGNATNAAPPKDTRGSSDTMQASVGAHQAHLLGSSGLAQPVACGECHVVPTSVEVSGHIDADKASVTFGELSVRDGASPSWIPGSATCAGNYCHGATLSGGATTSPVWTRVDNTQDTCGSCHGFPPPPPHVQTTACSQCHTETMNANGTIQDKGKHLDGTVEVAQGQACNACHGSAVNAAPPKDTSGSSDVTRRTVGAHQAHLLGSSNLTVPVTCEACHQVPAATLDAGHVDATPAEVEFSGLATSDGAVPAWDGLHATCSDVYCHGSTLTGGYNKAPVWTRLDGSQDACGTCHGNPPPAPHPQSAQCGGCHTLTTNVDGTLKDKTRHIDGTVEVSATCNTCHGNPLNDAPPVDVSGNSSTSARTVGAHQAHLTADSALSAPVACGECHVVPSTPTDPGHIDGVTADVVFGDLATTGGVKPAWSQVSATCSSTYCHGATLEGGSNKTPLWTRVDDSQDACGSCHGNPPPAPHVQSAQCGLCHTATLNRDGSFKDATRHVNGTIDVAMNLACNACHGNAANAAPPVDSQGRSATSLASVGAHQAHVTGTALVATPVACSECHQVPADTFSAGHVDAAPAELSFGALAGSDGTKPAWDAAGATCSDTYCHGATLSGGSATTPLWTRVDGTQDTCSACHGNPPPSPHPQNAQCGACHTQTSNLDGSLKDKSKHLDGSLQVVTTCSSCHGNGSNAAPPLDTTGGSATTRKTVGAHQAHVLGSSNLSDPVQCDECHKVPASLADPGHRDAAPAEVLFGKLARTGDAMPAWNATNATCATTYCHGASLTGGQDATPVWTLVDGSQDACDSCHGNPPPAPHTQDSQCGSCHDVTTNLDGSIKDKGKHINGTLEVTGACNACHGSATNPAPPLDTTGGSATTLKTVGAHQAHLTAPSAISAPVDCAECHVTVFSPDQPGHRDAAPAEVTFGVISKLDGANPSWSTGSATCSGTYCHGATLTGGSNKIPLWTRVDGTQDACGTCHGNPPPAPHVQSARCSLCHTQTMNADGSFKDATRHVDGTLDVAQGQTCHTCHGSATNDAPPLDTTGGSATSLKTVGAHQKHLLASSGLASPVACGECHSAVTSITQASHIDASSAAEVTFGALATTDGASPAWSSVGATCANTYCHGATLAGGAAKTPLWTKVDGTQETCTSCHGNPPPAPHAQASDCSQCHTVTMNPNGTFKDASKHVDGVLQVAANLACNACHGSAVNDAPPVDTTGGSATTLVGVGAHQAHLTAQSGISSALACTQCHVVPATMGDAGHLDSAPAEVTFGALARSDGATPTWSHASATCATTYCHGATLGGGTNQAPLWTKVDHTQDACGTCHGTPPPAPHAQSSNCAMCHTETMNADGTFKAPAKHVNGTLEVAQGQACNTCHGNATNSAPPKDSDGNSATTVRSVGAHQAHLLGSSNLASPVACQECHSVPTDTYQAGHVDPSPAEVKFGALSATGGLTPAWNTGNATCSNTYCHGAGMSGGLATTPLWTKVDNTQDTCASCHGNPPPAPHPQNSQCGLCHQDANNDGTIKDKALHVDGQVQAATACNSCHGSALNDAPPVDTTGGSATTLKTVGAHQAHLTATSGQSSPIACTECHLVPANAGDAGHVDASPAEVVFGSLSRSDGASPAWSNTSATCNGTYCHGATLSGGTNKAPLWTRVDGTQDACGTCHGNPPPAPHVQNSACATCHTSTMNADGTFKDASKHVNGTLEVITLSCNSCHGNATNSAPPVDINGGSATTLKSVGAHQQHLTTPSAMAAPLACTECHTVPSGVGDAGHLDASPAEVVFGTRSRYDGASPAWSNASATCSGTYCHGATLGGGTNKAPLWTKVDGTQDACGTCHGNPPPAPHVQWANCSMCHNSTMNADGTFRDATRHINGTIEVASGMACNACHGNATNSAPPVDAFGNSATTVKAVGAHQPHLTASSALASPVACTECHTVPADTYAAGHIDATPAEVVFGAFSKTGGLTPAWNSSAATCSNTYCHGGTLPGGTAKTPLWTKVDNTQDTCGSCHGNPPAAPHSPITACGECHLATMNRNGTFKDVSKHINGTIDVPTTCNGCHGDSTQSATNFQAPPIDLSGNTATTNRGVGAHQPHLLGSSSISSAIACSQCHTVPAATEVTGHVDSAAPAELTFGALARTGGLTPAFSTSAFTCSNTWCHGAGLTLAGGSNKAPTWTTVNNSMDACGTCHASAVTGMTRPHPQGVVGSTCATCHGTTMTNDTIFRDKTLHVNGTVNIAPPSGSFACNGTCHGQTTGTSPANQAPPADTQRLTATSNKSVGDHQNHLTAASNLSLAMPCNSCHAVPTAVPDATVTTHLNKAVNVTFTVGTLAKKTVGAYNSTTATCTTIYCHGGWTNSGATTTSRVFTTTTTISSCTNQCHGLPPSTGRHTNSNHVNRACGVCHQQTAKTSTPNGITTGGRTYHINGSPEVQMSGGGTWNASTRSCTPSGCHGAETWGARVLP
jgi:predicted CxxxxCH...CXXCH cytochrome family protein